MENQKNKIIPNEIKFNIDGFLEAQLFNANRYYAESNPELAQLINIEIQKKPSDFYEELTERWNWHNIFYEELLEPVFLNIVKKGHTGLTPIDIFELIKLYETCCAVDEATLIVSAAIKAHLELKLSSLITHGIDTAEKEREKFMLLTPPQGSFYSTYRVEHLEYFLLIKTFPEKAEKYRKMLLKKYHCDDEEIYRGRIKKLMDYEKYSVNQLIEAIEKFQITNAYKVEHGYFTLENIERKYFSKTIAYDNIDEKMISTSLIGISGFLLRREILKYLNDSKLLENSGRIYEFSNNVIVDMLLKLAEMRKIKMNREYKHFHQHGDTCAIACLLMVLNSDGLMTNTKKYHEKKYYKIYKSEYIEGVPLSALAWHFTKNEYNVELIHSDKEYFSNDFKYLDDDLFINLMSEYKSFCELSKVKGAKMLNGVKVDNNLIKKYLQAGYAVIAAGNLNGVLHTILCSGYDENGFFVNDPLHYSGSHISYDEMKEFIKTPIGEWVLAVKHHPQLKRNLMDSLDKFREDSDIYLRKFEKKEKTKGIKK